MTREEIAAKFIEQCHRDQHGATRELSDIDALYRAWRNMAYPGEGLSIGRGGLAQALRNAGFDVIADPHSFRIDVVGIVISITV